LTSLKTYYGDIFPSRRKIVRRRKWLQRAMVLRGQQRKLIVNRSKVCRNRKQSSKLLTHPLKHLAHSPMIGGSKLG
jgi:hypothetical protein